MRQIGNMTERMSKERGGRMSKESGREDGVKKGWGGWVKKGWGGWILSQFAQFEILSRFVHILKKRIIISGVLIFGRRKLTQSKNICSQSNLLRTLILLDFPSTYSPTVSA
ncbi:hypothetical protein CHS0354_007318 [Potamilus streckersoni]|uniref:Uncharacterized protein n=1 Tax=Potamilus streckersoni TaxID=2493646 RepID=A0AAE0TE37_9BIVA|nr:hypothetical protein CHS0354_007318 [Potamilus streckersoni]